jgi:hypothetical protein
MVRLDRQGDLQVGLTRGARRKAHNADLKVGLYEHAFGSHE